MEEQMSLFGEMSGEEFAERCCKELNTLETYWKGTFKVEKATLEKWDHVNLKNKVLCISIKSPKRNKNNYFIQFEGDHKSQVNLYNWVVLNQWAKETAKDKDFAFCITPWTIYIYYHNWENKHIN